VSDFSRWLRTGQPRHLPGPRHQKWVGGAQTRFIKTLNHGRGEGSTLFRLARDFPGKDPRNIRRCEIPHSAAVVMVVAEAAAAIKSHLGTSTRLQWEVTTLAELARETMKEEGAVTTRSQPPPWQISPTRGEQAAETTAAAEGIAATSSAEEKAVK